MSVEDLTGNSVAFDGAALRLRGFAADLVVASSPEEVTPAAQTSFDLSPKTADAGSGPATITCEFGFTDSPAGLWGASCDFNFTDASVFASHRNEASGTSSAFRALERNRT